MSNTVTVVDYGIGNVFSVCQAITQIGGKAVLTGEPGRILAADHLILPGVGSFAKGMKQLCDSGLDDVIKEYCTKQRPFLGICLGMQMLMESSGELGRFDGLGLIPGSVERLADCAIDGRPHKIPHIAWAPLLMPPERDAASWRGSALESVEPGRQTFYIGHS